MHARLPGPQFTAVLWVTAPRTQLPWRWHQAFSASKKSYPQSLDPTPACLSPASAPSPPPGTTSPSQFPELFTQWELLPKQKLSAP